MQIKLTSARKLLSERFETQTQAEKHLQTVHFQGQRSSAHLSFD